MVKQFQGKARILGPSNSDGSLINMQGLPARRRPAMETAKPGPLQLIDNGVQCFGFKTQFRRAEFIKPETKQPQQK
jgi:hypothetical protein